MHGELSTREPHTGGIQLFLVLGSAAALGPAALDIYLPGLPEMSRDLAVTPSAAQLTLTTFLVGLAVGQLFGGALSDVYGRRTPLVAGIGAFTLASAVCAAAPDLYTLAVMRFVQGGTAAIGMVIARAVVRDLYSGAAAARYLSRLMLVIGLAPMLAPVLGGQILHFAPWRSVFVAVAAIGLCILFTSVWLLPETLPPQRRRPPGADEMRRTFRVLLTDSKFVGYTAVAGFGGAAIFGFVAGSSFALEVVYGASPQLYGVLFGACAIVLVIGAQINAHLLKTRSPRLLLSRGLAIMLAAAVALVIVVSSDAAALPTVMPLLGLVMFSWSFIQVNAIALALTDYPHVAGAASSVLGLSGYLGGAAAAPLVGIAGSDTALPMAIVIVSCTAAATCALRCLAQPPVRAKTAATGSDAG